MFFCDAPLIFGEFLEQAFDGIEVGWTVGDRGETLNLQIRIGTVTMMISQSNEQYPAMPTSYYIYVANADDSMDRAINAGARLEIQVMDVPYGDRQGGVVDPFGNIWWVSQRLTDKPYHD